MAGGIGRRAILRGMAALGVGGAANAVSGSVGAVPTPPATPYPVGRLGEYYGGSITESGPVDPLYDRLGSAISYQQSRLAKIAAVRTFGIPEFMRRQWRVSAGHLAKEYPSADIESLRSVSPGAKRRMQVEWQARRLEETWGAHEHSILDGLFFEKLSGIEDIPQ